MNAIDCSSAGMPEPNTQPAWNSTLFQMHLQMVLAYRDF